MNVLEKIYVLCPYCNNTFLTYYTPIETCPRCGNTWENKRKKKYSFLMKIIRHIKIHFKMYYIKYLLKREKNETINNRAKRFKYEFW